MSSVGAHGTTGVRTLFVMPDCRFPPTAGASQRMWRNIAILSRIGPVAVFSAGNNEYPHASLPGVDEWRHVERREGPSRSRRVLERAVRTVKPAQFPHFDLASERHANRALARLIADFRPTIAVLDHWRYAIAPEVLRKRRFPLIVGSHNVEWGVLRDLADPQERFPARLRTKAWIAYFRMLEGRLYRAADRIWAVSELDRQAIRRFARPTGPVKVLPIITDVAYYDAVRERKCNQAPPARCDGPTIFYAGAYWYKPNVDAAHLLLHEIFPRLRRECSGARLILVGASPSQDMIAAARTDDRIVVTDLVEDLRPYLCQADVVCVPLLEGGGIRTKILEAFAAGIPVVSTTKGAEGIDALDGRDLLIRDGSAAFAAGIKALWRDPSLARAMAERALRLVRENYSMEAMETLVRIEFSELRAWRRA